MTRPDIYRATIRELFAPVADLLFDDKSVSEVLINGPSEVYFEREGRLVKADAAHKFADEAALLAAVRNIAEYVGRRIDNQHHSLDARLPPPEQFRVHAIIPPVSQSGVCVSIRKFRLNSTSLDWLVANGSVSADAAEYLTLMVRAHANVVVSGGTGAGKTSLLNALSTEIDPAERVVVIEDSSELRLAQPHTIYLEARPASPDGTGAVTIRNLFVDSLRMRPDRIIVGEVRRGEALDLIQSMLSGHDGALSTVHASSPLLALVRLETLCLMNEVGLPVYVARTQVASAIQVVVQIARRPDGSRRVTEIAEIAGLTRDERYRVRTIFRLRTKADGPSELAWVGKRTRFARKIRDAGIVAISDKMTRIVGDKSSDSK